MEGQTTLVKVSPRLAILCISYWYLVIHVPYADIVVLYIFVIRLLEMLTQLLALLSLARFVSLTCYISLVLYLLFGLVEV